MIVAKHIFIMDGSEWSNRLVPLRGTLIRLLIKFALKLTHPDIASLVDPLYASVKRVFVFLALFALAQRGQVQRSVDRVS